jgi:hypothetical protein
LFFFVFFTRVLLGAKRLWFYAEVDISHSNPDIGGQPTAPLSLAHARDSRSPCFFSVFFYSRSPCFLFLSLSMSQSLSLVVALVLVPMFLICIVLKLLPCASTCCIAVAVAFLLTARCLFLPPNDHAIIFATHVAVFLRILSFNHHRQYLCELTHIPHPPTHLHAQQITQPLQHHARQPRQVAALVGADLLVGVGQDDTGAEHDVEEGVVDGDEVLRPREEDGAFITSQARVSVALDDGLVDVSVIVLSRRRCIECSVED